MIKIIFCALMMLVAGTAVAEEDPQTVAGVNALSNAIKPCPCNLYEDNNDLASSKPLKQQAEDRGNEFNKSQPGGTGNTSTQQ